jgi:rod shape-determining protein MreC
MGRLFELLAAYRNVFYFLLLEGISLSLLNAYSNSHNGLTRDVVMSLSGEVFEVRHQLFSYMNLGDENERLIQMNMNLQQQLNNTRSELNTYKYRVPYRRNFTVLPDSVVPRQAWQFTHCRVINNTIASQYNFLTLNAGSRQGVKPEMGVVSTDGVAGVVVSVSEDYSLAMSILNKNLKLYAKLKGQNIFGTLTWEGGDFSVGKLAYIPQHFQLQVGDTIVTSGYGSIFPEGIFIGTIKKVEPDLQGSFYDIELKLGTDFFRLDNVYLIQQRDKARIDSLVQRNIRLK